MKGFPTREQVERIKLQYPPGTRICVDNMSDDPRPIPPNTMGTVQHVDDIGTVHCCFDNSRQLGLIPGVDSFHIVQQSEEMEQEEPDIDESAGMTIDL